MIVVTSAAAVRAERSRLSGILGLVPTMGALHAGHAALVRRSTRECDHTAASIFVNPTQFDDRADLATYPRDLERDLAMLADLGVDLVWTPPPEEVYPPGYQTFVEVRELSKPLEGAARRGHFSGVATWWPSCWCCSSRSAPTSGARTPSNWRWCAGSPRTSACRSTSSAVPRCGRRTAWPSARATPCWTGPAGNAPPPSTGAWQPRGAAGAAASGGAPCCCARPALPSQPPDVELEYLSVADPDTLQELEPIAATGRALVSLAARVDGIRLIDNVLLPDDVEEPAPRVETGATANGPKHARRDGASTGGGIMLLGIDVGNSNIVLGVFEGESLRASWRIHTRPAATSDEYGVLVAGNVRRGEPRAHDHRRRGACQRGAAADSILRGTGAEHVPLPSR